MVPYSTQVPGVRTYQKWLNRSENSLDWRLFGIGKFLQSRDNAWKPILGGRLGRRSEGHHQKRLSNWPRGAPWLPSSLQRRRDTWWGSWWPWCYLTTCSVSWQCWPLQCGSEQGINACIWYMRPVGYARRLTLVKMGGHRGQESSIEALLHHEWVLLQHFQHWLIILTVKNTNDLCKHLQDTAKWTAPTHAFR